MLTSGASSNLSSALKDVIPPGKNFTKTIPSPPSLSSESFSKGRTNINQIDKLILLTH